MGNIKHQFPRKNDRSKYDGRKSRERWDGLKVTRLYFNKIDRETSKVKRRTLPIKRPFLPHEHEDKTARKTIVCLQAHPYHEKDFRRPLM